MTVIEIAAEIKRSPRVDHAFKRKASPDRVVEWRLAHENAQFRSLMVEGDFWSPFLPELMATDWEFVRSA